MSQAEPNSPSNLPPLPADVRRRIDGHLDAIESVLLAGGVSRGERRGVVDEVETQIFDMLASRTDQPPAEAVAAILAQLDPPSAYAPQPNFAPESNAAPSVAASGLPLTGLRRRWQRVWSPRSDEPRLSRPALIAAVWTGLAAFFFLVVRADEARSEPLVALACLFGLSAPVGVTALGFWSVRRIRRSAGREYGLPLALVETFFFPVVLANLALIGLLAATDGAGLVVLAVLVIVGANVGLARYAWQRFGRQFLTRVESF